MKNLVKQTLPHGKFTFCQQVIIMALLSIFSLNGLAQEKMNKRHELYFGLGMLNSFISHYSDKMTEPIKYNSDGECFGIPINFDLDYKYRLTPRFSVGGTIGFCNGEHNDYMDFGEDYYDIGESDISMLYAMPSISYTWFKSDNGIFRAFSGAGLGIALLKEKINLPNQQYDKTNAKIAYNVTLAGLSVGGESFKFFAEMNGGCKGMMSAGLLVRF